MRGAPILLAAMGPLMLGGCVSPATPWDRLWDRPGVDFGCDAPGACRVRGRLEIGGTDAWPHGRLVLDDGRCLPVDLAGAVVQDREAWDGRRVAVRGRAVARVLDGPCGEPGMVLYAERVSVRSAR